MRARKCWWCGNPKEFAEPYETWIYCGKCHRRTPLARQPEVRLTGTVEWAGVDVGEVRKSGDWHDWTAEALGRTTPQPTRRAAVLWVRRRVAAWICRNVGGLCL
jgi:hypothetical protein